MIFNIQKNKLASAPLNIIQLTDSHLLKNPNNKFAGISPIESLQAIINCIQLEQNLNDCDAIITTGDIAQEPAEETYHQYLDEIEKLKTPHFLVPGNHDQIPTAPHLARDDGLPTVVLAHKWCLILLDSQCQDQIYGEFSKPYLEKLSQLLTQYYNYHVMLAFHHHAIPVGSKWLDQHRLQSADEFLECVSHYKNVKIIMSGHVHQEFDHEVDGIRFLSTPATSIQFKPKCDNFSLDDCPPGYRVLSLHADGSFNTKVHRLSECIGNVDHSLSEY